jgi:WD40 repeat protein
MVIVVGAAASIVSSDGKVLIIGGWDNDEEVPTRKIFDYDPKKPSWANTSYLDSPLCFCSATTTIDGDVVVSGGGDSMFKGSAVYDSCTMRRYGASAWEPLPPMLSKRCGHESVTLYDDSVVVLGGYGGGSDYLNTVERFDWGAEVWAPLPSMSQHRSGLGAGMGPDGSIYAVGGSADGSSGLCSFESLDLREGHWRTLPDMAYGRGYTSAAWGRNGLFYVFGGLQSPSEDEDGEEAELVFSSTIECYDVRKGSWRVLKSPLKNREASSSSVGAVDPLFLNPSAPSLHTSLMRACHRVNFIL